MLIMFAGGLGSGKDTMRELLIKKLNIKKEFHFSFASPLKDEVNSFIEAVKEGKNANELSVLFNINLEDAKESLKILGDTPNMYPEINSRSRTPEIRSFLQYWGTDVRRKQDGDYWVNIAREIISQKLRDNYVVIITDGRFNNEFNLVRDLGGIGICLSASEPVRCNRVLERDGFLPSQEALHHASEQDWRDYRNFDFIIENDNQTPEETIKEVLSNIC